MEGEKIKFLNTEVQINPYHKIDDSLKRTDYTIKPYNRETDMEIVMALIDNELSEPYSIFTYRYFLDQWPEFCFLSWHQDRCFGCVVCKKEMHKSYKMRGYIAMVVVDEDFRGHGIGRKLVQKSIEAMIESKVDEITLEAEVTNTAALALYEGLGFIREKRLNQYYLTGTDAFRLKLEIYDERDDEQLEEEEEILINDMPANDVLDESNIEETFEELSKRSLSIKFKS